MEYRRFPPGESPVSTFAYHEHRERAPHLEQPMHQWRLSEAARMVTDFVREHRSPRTHIIDLGCGDGGLMSLIQQMNGDYVDVSGYDFQPTNAAGWTERGVRAESLDFVSEWDRVPRADLYVCTEVLEHLEEPHELLRKIRERDAAVVCSSPHDEHEGSIDASHNWAWDVGGYTEMINGAGFHVIAIAVAGRFQVQMATPTRSVAG